MQLTLDAPEVETSSAPAPYDLLLGVVGTVRLVADDGRVVYEDAQVPIVELALALRDWLTDEVDHDGDFSYDSLESDQPGLLWCRRTADGWRMGSVDETEPDPAIHPTREVVDVFSGFVRTVEAWLEQSVGRQLEDARPRPSRDGSR